MKTDIVIDISPTISHLAKCWFSSYGLKCYQPIKSQDFLKCNISRQKEINIKSDSIILGVCIWVCPKNPK